MRRAWQVESLVGRAEVSNLALGDQHSLFLDRAGGLWAVGCSLEGQCGLGTPIEELARQHRRALYGSMQVEALLRNRPSASGAASGRHEAYLRAFAEAHRTIAEQRQRQQQRQQHARQALAASFLRPAAARGLGAAQYAGAIGGGGGGGSHGAAAPQLGISSSGIWGVDIERHLSATGLQPGVVHMPTRVMEARQLDATWGLGDGNGGGSGGGSSATMSDPLGSASSRDSSSSSSSSSSRSSSGGGDSSSDSSSGGGLEHERVVGVDCSRYFSIAVTHKGEVWTFGASYTGALAQRGVSWSTSARRVEGAVADAIRSEGGAVAVAAGGTGAACLTARCGLRHEMRGRTAGGGERRAWGEGGGFQAVTAGWPPLLKWPCRLG
jgi:hypothetical protein